MKAEQLRKSILQLAIQGKLVPQNPADEPASVLLEKIRAEKQKLIKEGKIKKDKCDSVIFKGDDNCYYEKVGENVKNITEDLPFDIPNSWAWCRFPNIVNFVLGKTPDRNDERNWEPPLFPWFSIADMKDRKTINQSKERISNFAYKDKFNCVSSPAGTLLMSFKLTVGRTSILGVDAIHNEAIISIFPYIDDNNVTRDYLLNLLGLIVEYVPKTDAIKGATLNSDKIKKILLPLPPLAEQARIVAAIEKYEPLIAEYEKLEQQATKLDDEIYDKLKKSILQYAIQGKLVPQDESDEPASVLLERIRAEKKAQLGKKYVDSYIYKGDDNCYYEHINGKDLDITKEIPFDLPDVWEWVRLSNLCYEISDIDHNMPKSVEKGVLFLSAKDLLNDGTINYTNNVKYVSEEDYQRLSEKSNPHIGDIIYSRIGACLGKARIVKQDIRFLVSYSCCTIKPAQINTEYLRNILDDVFVLKQAKKKTQSIGVPDLGIAEIKKFRIPVPPLTEQKRIVGKIDELVAKL